MSPQDSAVVAVARPALVGDAVVMAGRSMRAVVRTPAAIVAAIFMPLVLMSVMTISFAKVVRPDAGYGEYIDDVLPLFAAMGMMFSSVTTGLAVLRDLESGMDARLRTLPVARSAPLVGRIVGDGFRNLVTLVVLGLVAVALGFRIHTGVLPAVGAVVVALLFGTAFAWIAVAAAVRARSGEAVTAALNGVLLVLSFLSTGFVPAEDLPGWAQPIARVNPVSVTVEAVRVLTQGGPTTGPVLKALAWSIGLAVGFAALAVRGLARRAQRER